MLRLIMNLVLLEFWNLNYLSDIVRVDFVFNGLVRKFVLFISRSFVNG